MDTPVTEMADYFSALTTVLASFLAFNLRITATSSSPVRLAIVTAFVAFFAHHVFHMATVHFDYGYNMKVCVWCILYCFPHCHCEGQCCLWGSQLYFLAGLVFPAQVSRIKWLVFKRYDGVGDQPLRRDGPHILYGVGAVLLVASSVALELLDFPPIYWIVDSHAIWHFATVPLPLLWYVANLECLLVDFKEIALRFRFAAADALFHQKQNFKEEKLE